MEYGVDCQHEEVFIYVLFEDSLVDFGDSLTYLGSFVAVKNKVMESVSIMFVANVTSVAVSFWQLFISY